LLNSPHHVEKLSHNHYYNQTNPKPQSKPTTRPKKATVQLGCAHKKPQPQPKNENITLARAPNQPFKQSPQQSPTKTRTEQQET
jgi:hypothetical protein